MVILQKHQNSDNSHEDHVNKETNLKPLNYQQKATNVYWVLHLIISLLILIHILNYKKDLITLA